ncbi:MAG TPA: hypothetical protein VNZ03_28230 [Terriglobales bacterium]|nr:hypothetical protein [Terriglobales bacterium]
MRYPEELRSRVKAQIGYGVAKVTRGAMMKTRQILLATLILATVLHTAAAQPKKKNIQADAPPPESILASTSMQSNPVLSDLIALKPEMPLGPEDVLKSYEIAMNMVADKTSADFVVIVQAQQTNQITRQQAEYLLQQSYQMAMMQYQVLSALHDVLKHEIDKAAGQQAVQSLKATNSDTVLVVPFPESVAASR